jgi:hypothetical protein
MLASFGSLDPNGALLVAGLTALERSSGIFIFACIFFAAGRLSALFFTACLVTGFDASSAKTHTEHSNIERLSAMKLKLQPLIHVSTACNVV